MGVLQDDVAGDVGSVPRCERCGSERVVRNAWACWNPQTGLWELETTFDQAYCLQCEDKSTLIWSRDAAMVQARIRELNDLFRTQGRGNGSVFITQGVQAMGQTFVLKAVAAVRDFRAFSEDNNPWGEHDFGAIEIEAVKVLFKIDYYDPDLRNGSENPANERLTHRVLTIMLASEY